MIAHNVLSQEANLSRLPRKRWHIYLPVLENTTSSTLEHSGGEAIVIGRGRAQRPRPRLGFPSQSPGCISWLRETAWDHPVC